MRYVFTLMTSLFFLSPLCAQDTIPNAGFERWEQVANWYEEPVNWETNNTQLVTFVTKDSSAYEGDYSMKVVSGGEASATFPFSKVPMFGEAFVKTFVPAVDTTWIKMYFYEGDSVIASGDWYSNETMDTFQSINITLLGQLGMQCDSARIEIIGGKNIASQQTKLWVDELDVEFPLGLNNQMKLESLNIYPNPAGNQIRVTFDEAGSLPEKLRIIDISGRIVKTISMLTNPVSINLSELPAGKYQIIGTIDGKPAMSGSFVRMN